MRRAATQAFRSARRGHVRRLLTQRFLQTSASNHAYRSTATRPSASLSPKDAQTQILSSSMYFRNFSLAAIISVLASGIYYYQKEPSVQVGGLANKTSALSGATGSGSIAGFPSTHGIGNSPVSPQGPAQSSVEPVTEHHRRALIVEDDQFYAEDLADDTPLYKEVDGRGQQKLEMLTPEQATQQLRRTEQSYNVGRGRGVVRWDLVQLPSNNPIEDDHAERVVEVPESTAQPQEGSPSSDWMFWGVFDGHSGWTTSAKLRQVLISFVSRELNATYRSALTNPASTLPSPEAIDAAIKKGFLRLDHEIIHESVEKVNKSKSRRAAAELLAPALSGSCALLSFYDSQSKLFRVACTGDSRAVLGRRGSNGKWTATALSEDQTGGTPSEMSRLRQEHPGEDHVVRNGRILGGLEPSRAFGDAFYKWSREVQDRMKSQYFGRTPSPSLKTPPYVTAEPIVTTTKVEPEKGDFVVLATDGLWEMLTNEEVVGLVGRWLESQPHSSTGKGGSSNFWPPNWFGSGQKPLPVEKVAHGGKGDAGQRAPVRQVQWAVTGSDERFVCEDKNAATHLIRNALGGRDRDMVCALLTLPSPYSRRYRYVPPFRNDFPMLVRRLIRIGMISQSKSFSSERTVGAMATSCRTMKRALRHRLKLNCNFRLHMRVYGHCILGVSLYQIPIPKAYQYIHCWL